MPTFQVLVTADTGMAYQQNLKSRKIALVILTGNSWRLVQRVIRKIVGCRGDEYRCSTGRGGSSGESLHDGLQSRTTFRKMDLPRAL